MPALAALPGMRVLPESRNFRILLPRPSPPPLAPPWEKSAVARRFACLLPTNKLTKAARGLANLHASRPDSPPTRNPPMKYLPFLTLSLLALVPLAAGDELPPDPYASRLAKASDDGVKAIKRIQVPKGLKVDLFAAEPHAGQPGRVLHRREGPLLRRRDVPPARTASPTSAATCTGSTTTSPAAPSPTASPCTRSTWQGKFDSYEKDHDRVRLLEDTDGDGKADKATVFADGFNNAADGIGAGVLARDGKRLVHLHPRPLAAARHQGRRARPTSRSRCTPATASTSPSSATTCTACASGPTASSTSRSATAACTSRPTASTLVQPRHRRRAALQPRRLRPRDRSPPACATRRSWRSTSSATCSPATTTPTAATRPAGSTSSRAATAAGASATSTSKRPRRPGTPRSSGTRSTTDSRAYLVPPLANIADGPSGLTYHPGTGLLPERYDDHFFLVRLPRRPAAAAASTPFALKPKGASFELVDRQQFVWAVLATDCDFGPDGGFYVSDWVEGWNGRPARAASTSSSIPTKLQRRRWSTR